MLYCRETFLFLTITILRIALPQPQNWLAQNELIVGESGTRRLLFESVERKIEVVINYCKFLEKYWKSETKEMLSNE